MITRKKFTFILCVVVCVFIAFCFAQRKAQITASAASYSIMSDTFMPYSSDAAKISQTISANASRGYNSSIHYISDKSINLTFSGSNDIKTNHRIWVLTYVQLYNVNESEWIDEYPRRIASFCAHAGGGYNSVGQGLYTTDSSSLNENGSPKSIYSYTGRQVEDYSAVKDVMATQSGAGFSISLNIPKDTETEVYITTVAFQNGWATVSSGASVHRSLSFIVKTDDVAPSIYLEGAGSGITSGNVTVRYYDGEGSATGYYDISQNKNFPSDASNAFTSGTTFYEEGNYKIKASDALDNTSVKTFAIDRTAPTLTLNNLVHDNLAGGYVSASWDKTVGGKGAQLINDNDVLTVMYAHSAYAYPATADTLYSENARLTEEGFYLFTISDKAGNINKYYAEIDSTPPSVSAPGEYVNYSFTFSASDKHALHIEYTFNGGQVNYVDSTSFAVDCAPENFGEYKFRAVDEFGNESEWKTVKLFYRREFGNIENINNGYVVPTWYVVNLPQRIYTDCFGNYSFAEYASALAWAKSKEWEYRVATLSSGWSYVNYTNESVHQIYYDRDELDKAIDKYAKRYVSDRMVLKLNGALPENAIDNLVSQNLTLPAGLESYSGLPRMYLSHKAALKMPESGVDGNIATLTFKRIHNGVTTENGTVLQLPYGSIVCDELEQRGEYKQGWYLVEESDVCGNSERYLVYLDLDLPCLDGITNVGAQTFDSAFTSMHQDLMRYTELDMRSITDGSDEFAFMRIYGRGFENEYFVSGDTLPKLSYDNGYYGVYEITLYDRSQNSFSFSVNIAGQAPVITNTSLTNTNKCTLSIIINDKNNALVDVKLFKVMYTGESVPMYADDDGATVSADRQEYVLRTGGKYVLQCTDVYGRTVVSDAIFYMKGLPSGTFTGVKNGGLTNGDVVFRYGSDCDVIIYSWSGQDWIINTAAYETVKDENISTVKFTAGVDTSLKYKIFLYVSEDMNLFTEYTFEIDAIPPAAEVFDIDGNAVDMDGVTNKDFYLSWSESGYTVYYYNKKTGNLGIEKYTKEKVLSDFGTYVFEITDSAKNTLSFTVTLDNQVSYTLTSPAFTPLTDNSFITRNYFILTVTERTSVWTVTATNGIAPINGQRIDIDGTYNFHIEDGYGNVLYLTLIVDNLPPEAIITAKDGEQLTAGARTNKPFNVTCAETGVNITVSDGKGYTGYDGEFIEEAGEYSFKLTDRMGNVATITVVIDKEVSVDVIGNYVLKDDVYYSRSGISVTVLEDCSGFAVYDGLGTAVGDKTVTAEGSYTAEIYDLAGNFKSIKFVIDKTPPVVEIIGENQETVQPDSTINYGFMIVCEEYGSVVTYSLNGQKTAVYDGCAIKDVGEYYFIAADFLGNKTEFKVRIDYSVDFTLDGKYVEIEVGRYASNSWISVIMEEAAKRFYITSQDGEAFDDGDKITQEGEYNVFIEDAFGNVAEFIIIIDKTPPLIKLDGVESGENTKEKVTAVFENYSSAFCTLDGKDFEIENNSVFEAEGNYVIVATDEVGNKTVVNFAIDRSVGVTSSVEIVQGQIISAWIEFTFSEPVTAKLTQDGNETKYTKGRISEPGSYVLWVEDKLGNTAEYRFQIVPAISKRLQFEFDENYTVSVLCNGQIVTDAVANNTVTLEKSGNYELYFADGESEYTLVLTIDTTPPTVEITHGRTNVLISQPSKDGIKYALYRDGKQVDFSLGRKITKTGEYKLVLTDELGNVNEYDFGLKYINGFGIGAIIVAVVAVVVLIVILVVVRLRQRIK